MPASAMHYHSPPARTAPKLPARLPDKFLGGDTGAFSDKPAQWVPTDLSMTHAIHGSHRHVGGRWRSRFNNNEQNVGKARRRLELIELRGDARSNNEPWQVRVSLCSTYTARALTLLQGSGFVEAYHLMKASLELSLYTPAAGHLCYGDQGLGATPLSRGTRITALTLNNLAVYQRRRGQGLASLRLLERAELIEGDQPALSTQLNLCAVATELHDLQRALACAKSLLRRVEDDAGLGSMPKERVAVIVIALYNLGVAYEGAAHDAVGALALPDAAAYTEGDYEYLPENYKAREHVENARWCFDRARRLAQGMLGASHPVAMAVHEPIICEFVPSKPRKQKLGRTYLGQLVDGTTCNVGWPYFTLMNIQEGRLKQQQQRSQSASVASTRAASPIHGLQPRAPGYVPPPLPPAPAFLAPRPIHQGVLQPALPHRPTYAAGPPASQVQSYTTSAVRPSPTLSRAPRGD